MNEKTIKETLRKGERVTLEQIMGTVLSVATLSESGRAGDDIEEISGCNTGRCDQRGVGIRPGIYCH